MKKIFSILLIVVLLVSITGCTISDDINDSDKFKKEYESENGKKSKSGKEYRKLSIPDDNPFVYITAEELSKKIDKKETFIVYFGFSTCPWCRSVIEEMIKCAKDSDVDEIYYVDIKDIRDTREINAEGDIETTKEGTKGYMELLEKLDEVLDEYTVTVTDSEEDEISLGEKRIYAPNLVAVVDGKATKLEDGISDELTDPYMELTDEIKKDIYGKFKCIFKCIEELETVCTTKAC